MTNGVRFRRATAADLDSLLDLLGKTALPTAGVEEHRRGFLIAEKEGGIVACGGLERHGKSALLRSIAVAPSERGTGLGKAIVDRLVAAARGEGTGSLILLTTTAVGWFHRFGFEPISREEVPPAVLASKEFRGACPETAAVMRLVLG